MQKLGRSESCLRVKVQALTVGKAVGRNSGCCVCVLYFEKIGLILTTFFFYNYTEICQFYKKNPTFVGIF